VLARLAALGLGISAALWAATAQAGDKQPKVTNGGYMQASPKAGAAAVPLPLTHTSVDAEISGVVSGVKVTQHFHNPYDKPIEAVYVFSLPHRAAIHELVIRVGDRTITGKIKRRAAARAIYRRAKAAGRTAALLEQQRPNIFTQSIANILPRDKIQVTLRYVETLVPKKGIYEFVFPMVVGPRYVGGGEPRRKKSGAGWAKDTARVPDASRITPRLLEKGRRPGHDISVQLRIDAGGLKVKHLRALTHQVGVATTGRRTAVVLSPKDAIPNKDFVVRYQLLGSRPEVAVMTRRDRRGGHFLLMIQPKARMKQKDIAPREYVFVVDNSGSMFGFPLQQARAVVQRCLRNTRRTDTFRIIKFAGAPDQFSPRAVLATPAYIKDGIRYVSRMRGSGGTEFLPALKMALSAPKDPQRSRIVLFITDGYIGYEHDVLRYLRTHAGGTNVFSLGVGSSVNRFLIEGMARFGGAAPFYLLNNEKAGAVVERIYSTISRPALTNIKVSWHGLDVSDQTPARVPDLFGDLPVVLSGRYKKGGRGRVTISGSLAGKPFDRTVQVNLPRRPKAGNAAVAYLWARRRMASWMDVYATEPARSAEVKKKVTDVALRYNLMSRFTSFVAVDRRVRNRGGRQAKVPVPVPLPQGVSSRAAPPAAFVGKGKAGLLGLKGPTAAGATTIFGSDATLGADSEDAMGALMGSRVGTAYGVGGFGLSGVGRGGGTGSGTIGLGTLGTIGKGGGAGYGRLRGRRARAPWVKPGKATVRGALSRAIVRRIVRRHLNEVRFCYTRELGGDPKLAGRVVVQFTIAPTGMVVASNVASTTLGNRAAEACIAKAVRRWLFPKPTGGGIVLVRYPFVLKPPAGKQQPASAKPAAKPARARASSAAMAKAVEPVSRPATFRVGPAADGANASTSAATATLGASPAGVPDTSAETGCACRASTGAKDVGALAAGLVLGVLWRRRGIRMENREPGTGNGE